MENLRFYTAEEGKGVVNGEKVKATKDEVDDLSHFSGGDSNFAHVQDKIYLLLD